MGVEFFKRTDEDIAKEKREQKIKDLQDLSEKGYRAWHLSQDDAESRDGSDHTEEICKTISEIFLGLNKYVSSADYDLDLPIVHAYHSADALRGNFNQFNDEMRAELENIKNLLIKIELEEERKKE